MMLRRVEDLVADRLVLRAGFTPTDALHALGRLDLWDTRAADLGAQILAKQAGRSAKGLCEAVVKQVSDQAATALVSKVLSDEGPHAPLGAKNPPQRSCWSGPLDGDRRPATWTIALTLRQPVVAIGAPVEAYMPRVAERLHTHLSSPRTPRWPMPWALWPAVWSSASGCSSPPWRVAKPCACTCPKGVRDFDRPGRGSGLCPRRDGTLGQRPGPAGRRRPGRSADDPPGPGCPGQGRLGRPASTWAPS